MVYTALDKTLSEPIFRKFTEATGGKTRVVCDTEATEEMFPAPR